MIQEKSVVKSVECIADGVYSIIFETDIAKTAAAGQFVMVNPCSQAHLLGRPISICEINKDDGSLRLVFRVVGHGTDELSKARPGDSFDLLGPLGNGFDISKSAADSVVVLMGGGIGAPPLLGLAESLKAAGVKKIISVLGYRGKAAGIFLKEEFAKCSELLIATDDGSEGFKGNVVEALRAENINADIIYSCGPMPMLKAIKTYAEEKDIAAYISLEERMACGVGACLGCVVKTKKEDAHSHVNNARICTEGPVFEAREVDI